MATIADRRPSTRHPLATDSYERVLALGAVVLLGALIAALGKGYGEWGRIPSSVWLHLATIVVALVLTPMMLLRTRGDAVHRRLGWLWTGSMLATAVISLFIRESRAGAFSVIHILSAFTILAVPVIIWTARTHQVARHRRAVRGMVTGSLLVAGFFTFPFNRLLGHWLFS